MPDSLHLTPLHDLHGEKGGRMVPFAGYDMPVQYDRGIIAEHNHTRTQASLFDVSHMKQIALGGAGCALALERLVPANIDGLQPGRMRYTLFTNTDGGMIDDLMVTRTDDGLFLVVNASRFEVDLAHLRAHLDPAITIDVLADRALLALQGPEAAGVLSKMAPAVAHMAFMSSQQVDLGGIAARVNRCGYTGEDGYEISLAGGDAEALARRLLTDERVALGGLGARDSLRLEAGLCLYGQDCDETTTPVEANLQWTIPKRRREDGGFPGADVIVDQIANGPPRRLVGIQPQGRAPARPGTAVKLADGAGLITSGGFGPSVGGPVAMGYVPDAAARPGTALTLSVRGKTLAAHVAALPFVPHRYYRS